MKKRSRKRVRRWKYKNTILLVVSVVLLFIFADTKVVHALVEQIGEFGYFGAFVTGIFFVSIFTVVPATFVLFHLSQDFGALPVALFAGAGAVLGDLLIFRFLKDGVIAELRQLFQRRRYSFIGTLLRKRYSWLAVFFGALLIASPLPDEAGIALMGLSHIKTWQFAVLAFALNTLGILVILAVAQSI